MTIDERLGRLTERHEALTHSVVLLVLSNRTLSYDLDRMRGIMDDVLVSTARLPHVAEIHEKSLSRLEDGEKAS